MKRISKRTYFFMAVLSAFCATPMSMAQQAAPAGLKSEAKAAEVKVEADFDKAMAAAKKDGKKVMLEFSGQDWCPPCQMMHKFVIKTKDFAKYADEKLHVVIADFDRYGEPKSKEFAAKNKALAEKFQLRGFPTIVVLSPDGKVLDTIIGLEVRSPQELIERIDKAR